MIISTNIAHLTEDRLPTPYLKKIIWVIVIRIGISLIVVDLIPTIQVMIDSYPFPAYCPLEGYYGHVTVGRPNLSLRPHVIVGHLGVQL